MTLDHEIEIGEKVLKVTFEAFPEWESTGLGSYDFWGDEGFDEGTKYVSLEQHGSPVWNKEDYTFEENQSILSFMNDFKQLKKLEDLFCKEYASQINEPDLP